MFFKWLYDYVNNHINTIRWGINMDWGEIVIMSILIICLTSKHPRSQSIIGVIVNQCRSLIDIIFLDSKTLVVVIINVYEYIQRMMYC